MVSMLAALRSRKKREAPHPPGPRMVDWPDDGPLIYTVMITFHTAPARTGKRIPNRVT